MTTTVNTDIPAYINAADGVLTDGESWVALSTTILSADTESVTLESSTGANNWSQYLHLVLIADYQFAYDGASWGPVSTYFNDDTTNSNYKVQRWYSSGSSVGAAATTGPALGYGTANESGNADQFCALYVEFFDINSGKVKTVQGLNASDRSGAGDIYCNSFYWQNTSPITKIKIDESSGDGWSAESRFDLYGILPRMVTA